VVAGFVEACALLGAMKVEDLRTLEAFHETEAQRRLILSDASSCDEWFEAEGTESTLVALRVGAAFRRWAEIESLRKESASIEDVIEDVTDTLRSPPPLATLAAPWSLLADATFGRDETKLTDKSSVPSLRATRVIFFLDGERDSNASGNDNLSPAARWVLDRAGPSIIENFAHRTAETKVAVSWHQVSASKSLQTAALWRDVSWAAGSLVITALLVAFHANDFRLAFGAMAAVSASLIAANYVYAFLLEIHWVGALNFLGCFVIFAIGADDAFVLVEFWRKSEKGMMPRDENNVVGRHHTTHHASSMSDETDASSYRSRRGLLRSRMRWTLAKSGYAVTMTSATTRLAFAGNLASSVAPVRLFGAYMAALVACNYWLVCTSVPSLLVLAEKRKNKRGQLSFSREREQRQRVRQAETGGLLSSNVSRPPPRDDAPASAVDDAVADASGVADAVGATAVPPSAVCGARFLRGNVCFHRASARFSRCRYRDEEDRDRDETRARALSATPADAVDGDDHLDAFGRRLWRRFLVRSLVQHESVSGRSRETVSPGRGRSSSGLRQARFESRRFARGARRRRTRRFRRLRSGRRRRRRSRR
jgi:hypothetical protein